jgi:hypothetical protein
MLRQLAGIPEQKGPVCGKTATSRNANAKNLAWPPDQAQHRSKEKARRCRAF